MHLSRGEVLFLQGETGKIYYLKSGLLKVSRIRADGSSFLFNILVPGERFPHHSLVVPQETFGTVSAMSVSEVQCLPAAEWYQLLAEKPEQYREVAFVLQTTLRKMQKRMELTTAPTKDRIPMLREWFAQFLPNLQLEDVLTQEEIGQFLGMTRETVNRQLRNQAK
ncbi:Crp/Fnr family transcriptional regulator [Hazenella sp. IB182357]|uniref:Crp/Fnr family transcriptional regulator n=1 Tax=Polycladospora coralii TaxID=2771432 RepID=A0A926RTX1_9BACL|nr:Crp/Fnr family transcriptional regulator [Polycladospora coralii]MBS7529328.1 Crp/Fnr family transcriptional regulator [Polycladospora coralii]